MLCWAHCSTRHRIEGASGGRLRGGEPRWLSSDLTTKKWRFSLVFDPSTKRDLTIKIGDQWWFYVDLLISGFIQEGLPMKNGDILEFWQQKWWFNGIWPAKAWFMDKKQYRFWLMLAKLVYISLDFMVGVSIVKGSLNQMTMTIHHWLYMLIWWEHEWTWWSTIGWNEWPMSFKPTRLSSHVYVDFFLSGWIMKHLHQPEYVWLFWGILHCFPWQPAPDFLHCLPTSQHTDLGESTVTPEKKWGYENNNNGHMTVMTYMGNGRIYEHACDIWVDVNRFLGAWGFGCPKNPEWTLQSMEISPSNVGI